MHWYGLVRKTSLVEILTDLWYPSNSSMKKNCRRNRNYDSKHMPSDVSQSPWLCLYLRDINC
jgi:hypothetical protein